MPLPICVPCKKQMTVVQNDFPICDGEVAGFPSTVWIGDLYECPVCKTQIVTGLGSGLANPESADFWKSKALQFER